MISNYVSCHEDHSIIRFKLFYHSFTTTTKVLNPNLSTMTEEAPSALNISK